MVSRLTFILYLIFFASSSNAQEIIPFPNHYEATSGMLSIPKTIKISTLDHDFAALIPGFLLSARDFYGIDIKHVKNKAFIQLKRKVEILDSEAYRLMVSPAGITIEAGFPQGAFYGLQSLLQLLNGSKSSAQLHCANIEDKPRYSWRGLMLDESRHFFGVRQVKQILDLMSLHKLNKFHWHLTDAPGWRIEIKQYPLLSSVGGIGNNSDPKAAAKFYTQKEIAEIVEYARQRFIEVIPEIDMPGHATSAVRAYPEFSGGGSAKYPDFTFNPAKEEVYTFLTNVLKEVAGLFPSRYIHIGGDEVHFGNEQWSKLPEVRNLMEANGLKDLVAVEHYFLNRMADSIKGMGKSVIGWDEVVTAGLPSNNTKVMWWRHDKVSLLQEALDKNYEVILCPRIPLYFDFVQDKGHLHGRKWSGSFAPVEAVYHFPDENFTKEVSATNPLIKGIQANLWTEVIHTEERLQFMLYPRLSALAEAAWTEGSAKREKGFFARLPNMINLYKRKGITFFDHQNLGSSPEILGPERKNP